MKIAIVIPCYNEGSYIELCIKSILAQTVRPDEIIVVDNGSSDDTVIAAKKYPAVTVLHEPRQGASYARDTGFDAAKSELVARVDADSILAPDWVYQAKTLFEKNPDIDAAVCTATSYGFKPQLVGKALSWFYVTVLYFRLTKLLTGITPLYGPNMVIKKKAWQTIQKDLCHDDPNIHEDLDLGLHLNTTDPTILYAPQLHVTIAPRGFRETPRETIVRIKRWYTCLRRHR